MPSKTYKGKFTPKNPKKYDGDPTNIIYRSLWEKRVMKYLDDNPRIISWQSEEVVIPYVSPVDNRVHRYFPDFLIRIEDDDGTIKTMILEVKPYKETVEPKQRNRVSKQYLSEVMTWGVNQSKWKSAREFCADRGWEFRIITENELGLK